MDVPACFYRVSTKAIILNAEGKMLLGKERSGLWEHFGGGLDFGEDIINGLRREIQEETGLAVSHINEQIIASVPALDTASTYGEKVWKMLLLFNTTLDPDKSTNDFIPSDECTEVGYFSAQEILEHDAMSSPAQAIAQALLQYDLTNKQHAAWSVFKSRIDKKQYAPPLVSDGDIWWTNAGKNIGSEINGKNTQFSRPVIIYKKLARGFYLTIPITTQPKEGSWYVPFRHGGKDMVACLQQTRAMDYRRLTTKLGELDDTDKQRVKDGFLSLYG